MLFYFKTTSKSYIHEVRVSYRHFKKITRLTTILIFHKDVIHLIFCLFEDVPDCRDLI